MPKRKVRILLFLRARTHTHTHTQNTHTQAYIMEALFGLDIAKFMWFIYYLF